MGATARADRAARAAQGAWSSAVRCRGDAAHSLPAAMVRAVGRGDGRGAVRRSAVPAVRRPGRHEPPARPREHPALPASPGAARAGAEDAGGGERHAGGQGAHAQGRHGGGRLADRRAQLDEEQHRHARSGDAPDQEGQPVVLRDEVPHRRGRRQRPGAHGGGHGGQRQRRDPGACARAWRGSGRVRRCRLPGRRQARRHTKHSGALACGAAPRTAQAARYDRSEGRDRRGDGARQGAHPRQGRASVPGDQAAVRPRQGALPRPGEEHRAAAHTVRAVQPLDGTPTSHGGAGMSASAARENGRRRGQNALRGAHPGAQLVHSR